MSDVAIAEADRQARAHGAALVVLHVVPTLYPGAPMTADGAQAALVELERVSAKVADELVWRTTKLTGRRADDARQAMDAGADAVVVSNHGGRQLDGVAGSLRALPEVLQAVNGRIEVLMDGGIRRGGDIAKALAVGARAVLIGRAYAWALGAAGGPGVARPRCCRSG